MKSFSLTILGTSAAVPYKTRFLSGQVLNVHDQLFLIDCGEGTQFRLTACGIKRNKINHIFISHLHGDHFFGLFGVLTSFAMNGRKESIHVYSPSGLKEIVETIFEKSFYVSPFPIIFNELDTKKSELAFENNILSVHSFPLSHRIPTVGYVFREKTALLNIRPEKISEYNLSLDEIKAVKNGADHITTNGVTILNQELVFPPFKTATLHIAVIQNTMKALFRSSEK